MEQNAQQRQPTVNEIELNVRRVMQALQNDITFLFDQLRQQSERLQEQSKQFQALIQEVESAKQSKE